MRRPSKTLITLTLSLTLSLTLAACSPYEHPAAAEPATTTTTTTTAAPVCDQACIYRYAHAVETARIHRAYAYAAAVERARVARIYAFAAAVERERLARVQAAQTGGRFVQGIEVCNGTTLPTCGIVQRESQFNPNARNPASSAWGLYQFLRGTWRGVCPEFPHGAASVAQQVECARRLWNGGRGSGHWRLTR